jgi:hypothetical protein
MSYISWRRGSSHTTPRSGLRAPHPGRLNALAARLCREHVGVRGHRLLQRRPSGPLISIRSLTLSRRGMSDCPRRRRANRSPFAISASIRRRCSGMPLGVSTGEPRGSRPYLGALLLAYYDEAGQLHYAGRAGTGVSDAELRRLSERLQPLRISKMPLNVPSPRTTRFGSPLVLSRVHWVRPEPVCEVRFLTWTADGLLKRVVYEGLREDKQAKNVRRSGPV